MGLLDSLVGALGQGSSGGGQAQLINLVLGMLANNGGGGAGGAAGGLGALVEQFQRSGLGDVMNSWVGTGQNLPISGDQLESVLGGDTIAQIARQMGMTQGDAAGQLSSLLPEVIDKLTPQGRLPEGGLGNIGDLLGMLARR